MACSVEHRSVGKGPKGLANHSNSECTAREGFYADPIYGGNRDRVGWDLIGFPGPASLADVHSGRYSVVEYFADPLGYPGDQLYQGKEDDRGA
jgi:hypothetical protein